MCASMGNQVTSGEFESQVEKWYKWAKDEAKNGGEEIGPKPNTAE